MASDKIVFGLNELYYAVATESAGEDGSITTTYGTPKRWNGAVNISFSAEGQNDNFYADDMAYAALQSNSGYSGSLEVALIPDEVLVDVFGFTSPEQDGGVLENSDAKSKYVALMFSIDGDAQGRRMVFYRVKLARPAVEASTKTDSVEVKTQSCDLMATPRPDDHNIKWHCSKDDAGYADFFTSVKVPA